jgi:hypothetical protein
MQKNVKGSVENSLADQCVCMLLHLKTFFSFSGKNKSHQLASHCQLMALHREVISPEKFSFQPPHPLG